MAIGATITIVVAALFIMQTPSENDDGILPNGATVNDVQYAGISGLDTDLLDALRLATDAARAEGLELEVNSGWRSPALQDRLLQDAVATYGSIEEAARWVASAETSLHVSGDGVDIGPAAAAQWLDDRGAQWGLCRIYDNEPWHFELRPEAAASGCPELFWDPTYDPRMLP